ncbi:MAG: hypothetical protein RIS24_3214 [Verrucomicrobiota bacterium]
MSRLQPHPQLQKLREALLQLHKTLVDSERVGYEAAMGPIPSPNHFLRLLSGDPWFAWLLPLSRLIVTIDEALDRRIPLSPKESCWSPRRRAMDFPAATSRPCNAIPT